MFKCKKKLPNHFDSCKGVPEPCSHKAEILREYSLDSLKSISKKPTHLGGCKSVPDDSQSVIWMVKNNPAPTRLKF